MQGELGRAHDFAEGVTAFQQKRPAVFKDPLKRDVRRPDHPAPDKCVTTCG